MATAKKKATAPAVRTAKMSAPAGDGSAGDSGAGTDEHVEYDANGHPIVAVEQPVRVECVVDDGRAHVGYATHGGKICSAHAFSHHADGTPRG